MLELAIGYPQAFGRDAGVGAVVLVDGASGAELARLVAAAPHADLGAAVVRVGDLDGDGLRDLAVGQPAYGGRPRVPGSVLFVSLADFRVLHELSIDDPHDHGFGAALSHDEHPDRLVVGVRGGWSQHSRSDYGGVDVFELAGFERVVRVRFSAEHCYCERKVDQCGVEFDGPYGFGRGVLACEDLDGDGARDFLVAGIDELNGSRAYALSGADGHVLRIFEDER